MVKGKSFPWRNVIRVALLLLLVAALYNWGRRHDIRELAVRVQEQGPLPFFIAMTLVPLTGLPATPFYLLAGAVFGERTGLAATGVSILANLLLAFAITRIAPSSLADRARAWLRRGEDAERPPMSPWLMAALVRATPGPSVAMKSYLLGLSRIPLTPYTLVSWPFSMAYAAGVIILGDSAAEGRTAGMIAGGVLLIAFAGALFLLRRWLARRPGSADLGGP